MLAWLALLLPLAIVATAVVGVLLRNRRLTSQRQQGLAGFAADHGFQLTASDQGLATRWSRFPFGVGDHPRAVNVLTGHHRDRLVVAFDYRFSVYREGTYRYGVVAIRLPTALPLLAVLHSAQGLEVLNGVLAAPPIELESEWFNDEFRVLADDERYAHAVIHPRMMELLLDRDEVPWRIDGNDLVGWVEGPLEAGDVLPRIAALSEVADLIPSFVFADYGRDPRLG